MFRKRTYALIGAGVLTGLLAFVIPAFGSHDGGDAIIFTSADGVAEFKYPGLTDQTVTTATNGCQITNGGPGSIMTTAATGGVPGLNDLSIGVKANGRNANGTPCSQVDGAETLTLTPGAELSGRKFSGVSLDLEMTGNAIVELTFEDGATSKTYMLYTGTNFQALCESAPTTNGCMTNSDDNVSTAAYEVTSGENDLVNACAAPNSSGPNNQGNDNCIWTIDPAGEYASVKLTVQDVGTVSLESGADTGYPSHFYIANAAPVAVDDTATTDEDSSKTVSVLGNDTDGDGDTLSVAAVTEVQGDGTTATIGSVSLSGGVITYDPDGQFEGLNSGATATDEFTYTVSDGKGGSDTATVTVTITGVNDAPVVSDSSASGNEDTNIDVDLDIDDPDDTSFTSVCTSDDGTFTDDGDGTGTFTPDADFNGTATLSCTVTDSGNASDTATVTVTVNPLNDPPVANDDLFYFDDEDPTAVLDLTLNDSDIDGDTLVVSAVDTTGTLGTVQLASGVVSYTPPVGFIGSDSFGYTVSDGNGGTDTATVTIEEVIQCGEDLTAEDGNVWARYLRIDDSETGGTCVPKPYDLEIIYEAGQPVVKFVPREPLDGDGEPVDAPAKFSAELSFEPLVAVTNPGGGDDSNLEYDADAEGTDVGYVPMEWCPDRTLQFNVVDGELVSVVVTDATLPEGETWCIAYKRTYLENIDGIDVVRTVWTTFGIGDPLKRLS